jgi:hypothetical protein
MEIDFAASSALEPPVAMTSMLRRSDPSPDHGDVERVEFFVKKANADLESCLVLAGRKRLAQGWFEIESSVNSCCVGMIFRAGQQSEAVADLLSEGFHGAAMPGAIAVIGADGLLLDRLVGLAGLQKKSGSIPFEWPPILVSVSVTDPALVKTMLAVGEITAMGVPIELDVFDGNQPTGRIRGFLQKNLVQHFPKMF